MVNKDPEELLRWARKNDLLVCKRDAIYRLVKIINEVALGVSARVDENGEVYFGLVPGMDYVEMMGLKLIIHAGEPFRKPKDSHSNKAGEEPDDEETDEDVER